MIADIMPNSALEQPSLLLSTEDHDRLLRLARDAIARYPATDARLLLDELDRADVIPPAWMPAGIVGMNSHVEFRDDLTGAVRRVQLVYPYQADARRGRISVLSLVGAALIGLAEGQSITVRGQNGRERRLTVLRVRTEPFPDCSSSAPQVGQGGE